MGWLQKKDSDVREAFSRVKEETSSIFKWLHYFMKRHEEHDIRMQLIEGKMSEPRRVHVTTDDTKVAELKSYIGQLHGYIQRMNAAQKPMIRRLSELEHSMQSIGSRDIHHQKYKEFHQRLELLEGSVHSAETKRSLLALSSRLEGLESSRVIPEKKPALTQHVIKHVERDSKKYLRNVLLNLIMNHGQMSGTQIREMVVEEQKLTSKSSLYRALSELEEAGVLSVFRKAKEKIYLAKTVEVEQ